MKELNKRIEELRIQLKRHRHAGLKELPTRTIFIDPLLEALGWNVRDPDDVELEFSTIDGKAVDYALKVNRKPAILLEAKALDDPLDDVKAITQVVGYAANGGIDWCVLTNGVRYKIYRSSEKASAPEKLLFEVSLNPEDTPSQTLDQVSERLARLSKVSLVNGDLDDWGEQLFASAKVRKALDQLVGSQDESLLRLIRKAVADDGLSPSQIKRALGQVWPVDTKPKPAKHPEPTAWAGGPRKGTARDTLDHGETHHTEGKPVEVLELYRALDRFCQDRAQGRVMRRHLAQYVSWSVDKSVFCTAHLLRSGLKVWLKINPNSVVPAVPFARDVSKVGHWGVGDAEFVIDSPERLRQLEPHIQISFDRMAGSAA